jgi:hypothetical protein
MQCCVVVVVVAPKSAATAAALSAAAFASATWHSSPSMFTPIDCEAILTEAKSALALKLD